MADLSVEVLDDRPPHVAGFVAGSGAGIALRAPNVAVEPDGSATKNLKILHVFRSPVGGLFRHVLDVARGQAARGHRVGLIVDSTTGGARAEAALAELKPQLAFGIERIAIPRRPSLRDMAAVRHVARRIAAIAPDVLHGHGAKGAALVRLAPRRDGAIRVCTPHGGTLVYAPGTLAGGFYRWLERVMSSRTDLFLFESNFAAAEFSRTIARPRGPVRIVCNGVGVAEFAPLAVAPDASDVVFVGELRVLKGVDVLLEALAILKRVGRIIRATIAGEGPDAQQFKDLSERLAVADQTRFVGHVPAREAFAMGRVLVMPSRAESLPYVILEAAAAGVPIIATRVGGIPEIFGPQSFRLVPPDDAAALAKTLAAALADPEEIMRASESLKARVRDHFTVDAMVDGGVAAYCDAINARNLNAGNLNARNLARQETRQCA
jgi:glycosyltransferase involved in cell wall biosynthesis